MKLLKLLCRPVIPARQTNSTHHHRQDAGQSQGRQAPCKPRSSRYDELTRSAFIEKSGVTHSVEFERHIEASNDILYQGQMQDARW